MMKRCKVCGMPLVMRKDRLYHVQQSTAPLEALTNKKTIYEAFDCTRCGCQNIVGIRETLVVRPEGKDEAD